MTPAPTVTRPAPEPAVEARLIGAAPVVAVEQAEDTSIRPF